MFYLLMINVFNFNTFIFCENYHESVTTLIFLSCTSLVRNSLLSQVLHLQTVYLSECFLSWVAGTRTCYPSGKTIPSSHLIKTVRDDSSLLITWDIKTMVSHNADKHIHGYFFSSFKTQCIKDRPMH